jgi:hypothetical protein
MNNPSVCADIERRGAMRCVHHPGAIQAQQEQLNVEIITLTAEMAEQHRPTITDKAREARLRRKAASFDLRLTKSRARDTDRLDHGLYGLVNLRIGGMMNPTTALGHIHSWSLDDVEQYLSD